MNDFVELRRYVVAILKWWWLLVLAAIIGAAIGYWGSKQQPQVYKASATIMVGQSIQATNLDTRDIQTSERLALTYASIARRQPVLQGVVDTLGLEYGWTRLKSNVKVTPVADTQLLEITVEAGSPKEAQIIANEIARQLIRISPTSLDNSDNDEYRLFMQERLKDLQARIEVALSRRDAFAAAIKYSLSLERVQELRQEINTLESFILELEKSFAQLSSFAGGNKSPNDLAVVEPAQADPKPIRPLVHLNTLLAGIVGVMLALGTIFLVEYLDNTVKSPDDFSHLLGFPILGTVGRIEGKQYQDKIIVTQDPFSPASEAYRMIRSNIQFMSVDRPAKIIMVTSPALGEGKSTTVANLGVVMAQAGLKTIIVDADLRRPVQHQIFQVPNLGGLTDLLCAPELEINGHLKKTYFRDLQLITCGVLPPNPSELLGSQRMGQLLAGLHELADVIIFDSPPVVAVADAAVLSNRVDGVILVSMAGKTRRDMAKQAVLILRQAGAHFFGGVLNRVSKGQGGYYQQYYTPSQPGPTVQPGPARSRRRWQWVPFVR
jgi:non-specific protein-tyrosine kinase